MLQGRLPAILPWPTSRIDPEKYQRNLLHQLRHLPAAQLITLPRLAASLSPALPYAVTPCPIEGTTHHEAHFETIQTADPVDRPITPAIGRAPDDALFLQFSGGTTGTQKCVVVTAPMLTEQLARLSDSLGFSYSDSVVSWLPMYHDMGLIACLWLPLWHEASSLHVAAGDWLVQPRLLFRYIGQYHGTFCWLPNFAFSYLAGHRETKTGAMSLDTMRAWINCSEPVRCASMKNFVEAFADRGVRPESLQACYAMAENVFAVTQTPLGEIPRTLSRDRLRQGARAYDQRAFDLLDDVYVSSGKPLASMEIRIVDPKGGILSDAQPGEIQIRTKSLFMGYWGNEGFTRNSLSAAGWYSTGDYGFVVEDDLFVIGRLKDIIIVAGQNVFPEDVEAMVNTLDAVYTGRVVAFGIEDEDNGTESLVVVAELRGSHTTAAADALQSRIQRLVLSTVGIAPRHVAVVPERWIVKSTAGKISRRDTRKRFLQDILARPLTSMDPVANVADTTIHRRLENVFQTVFGTKVVLTDTTSAPDVPGWDSLNHLNLMFTIESEFGVEFAGNELADFRNIGELKRYLETRAQF
jgi:acyl-CoA synthetase (AMP-forming)/AMP-acid ligase II/acyl carrier protein